MLNVQERSKRFDGHLAIARAGSSATSAAHRGSHDGPPSSGNAAAAESSEAAIQRRIFQDGPANTGRRQFWGLQDRAGAPAMGYISEVPLAVAVDQLASPCTRRGFSRGGVGAGLSRGDARRAPRFSISTFPNRADHNLDLVIRQRAGHRGPPPAAGGAGACWAALRLRRCCGAPHRDVSTLEHIRQGRSKTPIGWPSACWKIQKI